MRSSTYGCCTSTWLAATWMTRRSSTPYACGCRRRSRVSARSDDALRDQAFGSSWPAIWSVRNRIAHGYVIIDRQIIVSTVDHDLPEFEEKIEYLSRLVSGEGGDA